MSMENNHMSEQNSTDNDKPNQHLCHDKHNHVHDNDDNEAVESINSSKIAVILLGYGSANSLDDIPAYLSDIRGGRHTPQELIDEITERYKLIGGKSPLTEITLTVGKKLEQQLGYPVYVGMRHWHPYVTDVVADKVEPAGVERLIAICMTPHYSRLSVGAYKAKLEEALSAINRDIPVSFIESWHTQADFITGLKNNLMVTLERFSPAERENLTVVFTAHSLPAFILENADPYDSQLRETARLVADAAGIEDESRWTFCYQSAAQTGVPWLGPQIEDLIPKLAQAGVKNVILAPVGFIADHVEVLYDLDIEARGIAEKLGLRVERTPMLNDSSALINALVNLVKGVECWNTN